MNYKEFVKNVLSSALKIDKEKISFGTVRIGVQTDDHDETNKIAAVLQKHNIKNEKMIFDHHTIHIGYVFIDKKELIGK